MKTVKTLDSEKLRTDVQVVSDPLVPSRWFITIGNPGFNSPANNAFGYKSEDAALSAIRRYSSR